MIILTRLMKASPSGVRFSPKSDQRRSISPLGAMPGTALMVINDPRPILQ